MSDTPGKSLEQPVQGDGYNDDAEAGRKAVADLHSLNGFPHFASQAPGANHGGNDGHGQGKHDCLIDPRDDGFDG